MRRVLLDCSVLRGREEVHRALAAALDLPEWYGGNLDALYDCLTDLSGETELRLRRFGELEKTLGIYARSLRRVLADAAGENPRLRVFYED